MTEIVNKIKQSKLETIDLEKMVSGIDLKEIDLKDFLFQGLILKEKEFREQMDNHDWNQYRGSYLTVYCSTDAIIPKWAFMLVVQYAAEVASDVLFGNRQRALTEIFKRKIDETDWSKYDGRFVLLKGCSKLNVSEEIYMQATKKLMPHVKKLMYGEACSNVPVYRKR